MIFKSMKLKREAEIKKMKEDAAKKAGLAFLAGSAVAAVVTLFTAPKSGKEMRSDVAKTVENSADIVKEKGEIIAIKAAEVIDSGMEFSKKIKDNVKKKLSKVEESLEESVEEVLETEPDLELDLELEPETEVKE